MQTIDLGIGDAGGPLATGPLPPLGWDLDGVCTCVGDPPGPPSCTQASGTPENCDDDAGRDHTGLNLFRKLAASAQMSLAGANEALQTGQYGLLLEMTDYNGQPNDNQVSVAFYFSNGVQGAGDGGVVLQHKGTDVWTVDPRSIAGFASAPDQFMGVNCNVIGGCPPEFVDNQAYVANNVLVANLGEVPITFGGRANIGGAVMDLTETTVVGTLVQENLGTSGQSWRIINGSVSGRWDSTKLLSNMATIPDPNSDAGGFICASTAYPVLKAYICQLQDIETNQLRDREGLPCDAISMSFGFTAEAAQLGLVAPLPVTPQGCDDGGIPFFDTCPSP